MARVIILGSASAVPDARHENTHMLVEAGGRTILVDCPGSPIVRLEQAGVDQKRLTDIILTHFHPDHVSGLAPLLMSLWLLGRKDPINIYGLTPTIDRAEKMMELYSWNQWPGFYPVNFVRVPAEEGALVFEDEDIRVHASPVKHLIPTFGLRFAFLPQSKTLAYSCDTEPTEAVCRLAKDVDVLIHESTGTGIGHTTPEAAGQIATDAKVGALYLIHYPPPLVTPETLLEKAGSRFRGPVTVAYDFLEIPMD